MKQGTIKKQMQLDLHAIWTRMNCNKKEVCSRWAKSFEDFVADMKERPVDAVLVRVDEAMPFTFKLSNCKWEVTAKKKWKNRGTYEFI